MKRDFWRKQHKYFGLAMCLFLLLFGVSGIVLNHRGFYSKVNVSRRVLPSQYRYQNWNAGLLRGTLTIDSATTLIYGSGGLWLSSGGEISDFNAGMPKSADYRAVRSVAVLPDSGIVAVTQYGLHCRRAGDSEWKEVAIAGRGKRERLSDVTCLGDSLLVLSRDNLYLSLPPYRDFRRISLPAPDNYDGRVPLFRFFWLLHNGAFFGFPGRMALDLFGIAMILLSISGFLIWICPKILKSKRCPQALKEKKLPKCIRLNILIHKKIGIWTFYILMLITITGLCLRPPFLIPIAKAKVPGIPYTGIDSREAWKDKLRAIRYDDVQGDWLLCSSDGFFSLPKSLDGQPRSIEGAPHVSVMGVNVMQRDGSDWLIGSLGGMWRWNRSSGRATDYFTGAPMPVKAGPPFGKTPVSGYSADFGSPFVVEYYDGTSELPQPGALRNLPMSAWQLALEVHTGRIYNLFGLAPLIWIFISGMVAVWVLLSGKLLLKRRGRRTKGDGKEQKQPTRGELE